jgi:hypothetical protein
LSTHGLLQAGQGPTVDSRGQRREHLPPQPRLLWCPKTRSRPSRPWSDRRGEPGDHGHSARHNSNRDCADGTSRPAMYPGRPLGCLHKEHELRLKTQRHFPSEKTESVRNLLMIKGFQAGPRPGDRRLQQRRLVLLQTRLPRKSLPKCKREAPLPIGNSRKRVLGLMVPASALGADQTKAAGWSRAAFVCRGPGQEFSGNAGSRGSVCHPET